MKTEVENLTPTRVRLSVAVPSDDLKPNVDAAYRKIASQVNIPGFRKGKVPTSLIDQRFGRAVVLEDAINDALPHLYVNAIEDHKLETVGQPEVDITEIPDPQAGGELKFTAEVDIRPEITIPEVSDITLTVENADVADDDVDAQLTALRSRFGIVHPVERQAKDGDFVTIDLAATLEGKALDELTSRGLSYEIGSGALLVGLDEALIGLSASESATFATALVGGEYAGKEADVTVTVTSVKERELPALDDDFAQQASEFDTVDELRDNVRTRLARAKRVEQMRQARDKVLEAVLERTDIPLPESAVKAEVDSRLHTMEHQLEQMGLTKEHYLQAEKQTEEGFTEELTKGAQEVVRAQLLLDAIVKKEQFSVSEDELTEYLVTRSVEMGMPPQEFARLVMENRQIPVLMSEIMRAKALHSLVEAVTVKDESGKVIDTDAASEEEADALASGDVDE